ncbi:unnamed protein product [Closterium sp. Yama58-4]|nr:unnamed protein product [Closterium sp. Yama58-4]
MASATVVLGATGLSSPTLAISSKPPRIQATRGNSPRVAVSRAHPGCGLIPPLSSSNWSTSQRLPQSTSRSQRQVRPKRRVRERGPAVVRAASSNDEAALEASTLPTSPFASATPLTANATPVATAIPAAQSALIPAAQPQAQPSATSLSNHFNLFLLKFIPLLTNLRSLSRDALASLLAPLRSLNLPSLQSQLASVTVKPAFLTFAVCLLLAASLPGVAHAAKSGGRVGGSAFSSSSSSSSSRSRSQSRSGPSQSYSYSNPSSSSSYQSRHYSANPSRNFFFAPSAPFFAPSPFFGGWGGGWGWGWSPFAPRPAVTINVGGRGGGGGAFGTVFNLLVFGMVTFALVQTIRGFLGQWEEDRELEDAERCSVVQLQVGLLGAARRLQADLERIADRADVTSQDGLHYLLQETILALLRHPDYCVYGFSSSATYRDATAGETAFNRASMEERRKFQEETVVNVGGDELQGVEVLWTPQDPSDSLTAHDILSDYPSMRML